jgi:hypothetical protein
MNKNYFLNIFKSTFLVLFLSFLGAFSAFLFNVNYFAVFILLFVIQFILFSFIGSIITSFLKERTKQKELDKLEPLSTILECAYCNEPNLITFFANQNERIEFECVKCKNKNLVNLTFSVARITQPVNSTPITGIPLINEKQE